MGILRSRTQEEPREFWSKNGCIVLLLTAGRRTEKKSQPDSGIHLEGGNELEQNKYEAVQSVLNQVNQVILGKEQEVREIMLAVLADGHILLEDMPGVGKTTLALAFS